MLHVEDCFWVLVSEGEAHLILQNSTDAASSYSEAIAMLSQDQGGMVRSAYNQVQRLTWALGEETTQPVLKVFGSSPFKQKGKASAP